MARTPERTRIQNFRHERDSITSITIDGNGNTIEEPDTGLYTIGATASLGGSGAAVTFQYDRTTWSGISYLPGALS